MGHKVEGKENHTATDNRAANHTEEDRENTESTENRTATDNTAASHTAHKPGCTFGISAWAESCSLARSYQGIRRHSTRPQRKYKGFADIDDFAGTLFSRGDALFARISFGFSRTFASLFYTHVLLSILANPFFISVLSLLSSTIDQSSHEIFILSLSLTSFVSDRFCLYCDAVACLNTLFFRYLLTIIYYFLFE